MGKKDSGKKNKPYNRKALIIKAGIIGVVANFLLAAFKALAGFLTNSIAITLDGINSLSDGLGSIITITGARLSEKAPDKKHPMGYGRIEYISSMIVTVIVLLAGFTSAVESLKSILSPGEIVYDYFSLFIVLVSIIVKIFLSIYMIRTGKKAESKALIAAGSDSKFDAILSLSVLLSALISLYFGISLEAYIGLVISIFIIKAGLSMFKSTMDDILGKRIDRHFLSDIKKTICSDPDALGAHDLILHNYGTGKFTGSVHVEVPDSLTAVDIDLMQRRIYNSVYEKHNVTLEAIGIYALSSEFDPLRDRINDIIRKHKDVLRSHGFFFDPDAHIMRFDIIINYDAKNRDEICEKVKADVQAEFPGWEIHITPDIDF